MVRGFPSPKCQWFNFAMLVTGHVPFGSACGCWSLEPGLGRYCWSCKPLEKEEEAAGTVKSCGSDTWLSHISPPFSLWGINFAPRCNCFCSDLNLKSPGLTQHYSVPCSTAGPSIGCSGLGGCILGHTTIQVRKDLLAAKVTPQEGKCRWQEIQRSGLLPCLYPTAVRDGWGELGLVLFLPVTEKALDDIQPLLTGLSAVLTWVKGKPLSQLHFM